MNSAGVGNCWRIAHHPLVDRYRPAQRPLSLCLDGKEEMDGEEEINGEVLASARPGRPPTGFAGAHFLPATGSLVHATRPSAWPALILLPSLGIRGGADLQGLSSLDC